MIVENVAWFNSEDFWSIIIPFIETDQLKRVALVNRQLFKSIVQEEKFTPFYRPTIRLLITYVRKKSYSCFFPLKERLFNLDTAHEGCKIRRFEKTFLHDDLLYEKIKFEVHVDLLNESIPTTDCGDRTFDGVIVVTEKSQLNLKCLATKWKSTDFRTCPTPLAIINLNSSPFQMHQNLGFSEIAKVFNVMEDRSTRRVCQIENDVWEFFRRSCVLLKEQSLLYNRRIGHQQMVSDLINMQQPEFYKLVSQLSSVYKMNNHFGSPFWCGFFRITSFYEMNASDQMKLLSKWCTDFLGYDTSYDCLHVCGSRQEEAAKLGKKEFDQIQKYILKVTRENYQPVRVWWDKQTQSFMIKYWAVQDLKYCYQTIGYRIIANITLNPQEAEKVDLTQEFKETDRLSKIKDYLLNLVGYKEQSVMI